MKLYNVKWFNHGLREDKKGTYVTFFFNLFEYKMKENIELLTFAEIILTCNIEMYWFFIRKYAV